MEVSVSAWQFCPTGDCVFDLQGPEGFPSLQMGQQSREGEGGGGSGCTGDLRRGQTESIVITL